MRELATVLEEAKIDLEAAESRFNNAINTDDIDIAIFEIRVAEIKINSLIKSAKLEIR